MAVRIYQIIILVSYFSVNLIAQHANDAESVIREGGIILAKQSYYDGEGLKARCLTAALLTMDENNEEALELAEKIRNDQKVRLHHRLLDKGKGFAKYLEGVVQYMTEEDYEEGEINFMLFVGAISHSEFKLVHEVKHFKQYMGMTKKYFPDYRPTKEEMEEIHANNKPMIDEDEDEDDRRPLEKAREIFIEKLTYNPQNLLNLINHLNLEYKGQNLTIEIEPGAIPYEDVIEFNETIKYIGQRLDMAPKNLIFRKVTLLNIIHYLEHTLDIEFIEEGNSLIIVPGVRNEGRRPQHFQNATKFRSEIKRSVSAAAKKYDKETVQLKGIITETKLLNDKLLLELNDHFVVEIDKKLLKSDTADLIKRALSNSRTSKYLQVMVRGVINIKSTRTYITKCSSLIAQEIPYFYLNN